MCYIAAELDNEGVIAADTDAAQEMGDDSVEVSPSHGQGQVQTPIKYQQMQTDAHKLKD